MAKKKLVPVQAEPVNSKGKYIKALIIGGTFVAIAALSIIAQGPGGERPALGVVAVRIVALSVCAAFYFWMVYRTQASRQKENQKPQAGKK